MSVVRLLSLVVVCALAVVVPFASRHAEAASCQDAIESRGSALLSATTNLMARCRLDQLRTGDLDEGCPDADATARLERLTFDAVAAVARACGSTPATATGLDAGAGEGLSIPIDTVPVTPQPARGAKLRCLGTIGRRVPQFVERKGRLLAQCSTRALAGVAGYGPAGPLCDGPNATQQAIADGRTRLAAKIGRACGGPDGTAGTGDDLDPQTDLGFGASCTGAPYCTAAIDTLPALLDCVTCVADEEVSQVSRGLAALPLGPATACDLGRRTALLSLFEDDLRDFAACEDRVLDGHENHPPCPDDETTTDLVTNVDRYGSRVAAACGAGELPPADVELLALLLTGQLYPTGAEEPDNAKIRCKTQIARSATSSVGYARRQSRTLRTCHTQLLCGQTSGACPDSEAADVIDRTATTYAADVHEECDAYTPSDLGYGATCGWFPPCDALPTTTIAELVGCLRCAADEAISEVIGLF
jgi:hypothetical protein